MLEKEAFLRALAEYRTNEVVITTMSNALYWGKISDHPLDYASIDSAMGHAPDFALGIALARPDTRVIVLNGDGSMLMNLGTLVTIRESHARNIVLIIMENDTYEVTGNQPIPGSGVIQFTAMARSVGYEQVYEIGDLANCSQIIPKALRAHESVVVNVRLRPGIPEVAVRRQDQNVKYLALTKAEATHRLKAAVKSFKIGEANKTASDV